MDDGVAHDQHAGVVLPRCVDVEGFEAHVGDLVGSADRAPLEGNTAVFTKRRYRDAWNRCITRRVAKSIIWDTFFENVDFEKISVSPRREHDFRGSEPPKNETEITLKNTSKKN